VEPQGGGAGEPVGLSGHLGYLVGRVSGGTPQTGSSSLGGFFSGLTKLVGNVVTTAKTAIGKLLTPTPGGTTPWDPGLPPVAPVDPGLNKLKTMSAEELKRLGALPDKSQFFAALRPAAQEAERTYGVPAAVIMAQAALETGWGKSIIPGFNIFGHKGTGPAGTVAKETWEVVNGKTIHIVANFAKYHSFYEGVVYHGKRFHNGYYNKAVENYAKYKDPDRFARDITGIYATDPAYGSKLISIMNQYGLKK
jgi:hypothetical protein